MTYRAPVRGATRLLRRPEPKIPEPKPMSVELSPLLALIDGQKKEHDAVVADLAARDEKRAEDHHRLTNMLGERVAELEAMIKRQYQMHRESAAERTALGNAFDRVKRGPAGQPGKTPAIDYARIAADVAARLPRPKDGVDEEKIVRRIEKKIKVKDAAPGKNADPELVIEKIVAMFRKGDLKLHVDHLDGFEQTLAPIRNLLARGGIRGGGDTVAAGTGVTIATLASGKKQISATGGVGTVYTETLTDSGDHQNFTALHAIATVFVLAAKNGQYIASGNYSKAGSTITLTSADANIASVGLELVYA